LRGGQPSRGAMPFRMRVELGQASSLADHKPRKNAISRQLAIPFADVALIR
jgi:hypothetical protein